MCAGGAKGMYTQTICLAFFWKCREPETTRSVIPACWLLLSTQLKTASSGCRTVARALSEPCTSPGETELVIPRKLSNVLSPTPTLLLGKSHAFCYVDTRLCPSLTVTGSPKRKRATSRLRPTARNTQPADLDDRGLCPCK